MLIPLLCRYGTKNVRDYQDLLPFDLDCHPLTVAHSLWIIFSFDHTVSSLFTSWVNPFAVYSYGRFEVI